MSPTIFTSDFDGVICDGLREYFASTKIAYQQIWGENFVISDRIENDFYQLRPVIETGWEMPVLLRALVLNYEPHKILTAWQDVRDEIANKENLERQKCSQALDRARDNWIQNDLDAWLNLHDFYPGIIDKVKQIINSEIHFYIITTKESRFVRQLLEKQGIQLTEKQIIGKESKRPKYETLRMIRDYHQQVNNNIWFLEDRFPALQQVTQQSDLQGVKLFLADWGYNTESDRIIAHQNNQINLLSLSQFAQDFSTWLS